jgi:hypothetical protein
MAPRWDSPPFSFYPPFTASLALASSLHPKTRKPRVFGGPGVGSIIPRLRRWVWGLGKGTAEGRSTPANAKSAFAGDPGAVPHEHRE